MIHLLQQDIAGLISTYGYALVALVIFLESMGLPLPGETTLVLAALYAGNTGELNIAGVIAAAAAGAIAGDNTGYWLGRDIGFPLLLRHRHLFRLSEGRLKLGQYLFMKHGGKVVFFGRFIALLRTLGAFLAGVNHMEWRRFMLFNAAGGIIWTGLFGGGAWLFGSRIELLLGPAGIAGMVGVAILGVIVVVQLHRHANRLEREAEIALPGPLVAPACRRARQASPG
jgi:membrane protein DedA with SNARE-associated domain